LKGGSDLTALALIRENPSRLVNTGHAIDLYLGDLARRGRSVRTLDKYRRHLGRLADVAPGRDTHELELADYERFLNQWVGSAASTMASGVSLCRGFSRFLFDRELAPADVAYPLQRPRRPRPDDLDVVTVTAEDVHLMLAACEPVNDTAWGRWQERLCLATAICLGSRRAALARVRRGDVDLVRGTARFLEKGGKVVLKAIPDEYKDFLVAAERDGVWESPLAYLIPNRRPGAVRRVERSDKFVWETVKLVAARVGVRAHVHALRAAFAVAFDEKHPDELLALKDLMGHARLETTLIYLRRRDKARGMESVRDLSWGLTSSEPGAFKGPSALPARTPGPDRKAGPTPGSVLSSSSAKTAPVQGEAHTGFEPVFQPEALLDRVRREDATHTTRATPGRTEATAKGGPGETRAPGTAPRESE
jgi:integrase